MTETKASPRRKRTREELEGALRTQVGLLIDFCASFDGGNVDHALPIATTLRTLFHTPRRGRALLDQLGLISGPWRDLAAPIDAMTNMLDSCNLVSHVLSSSGPQTLPNLDGTVWPTSYVEFSPWWTSPIGNSAAHGPLTREDVIVGLASTEAAHIDPEVTERAIALREGTYLSGFSWFVGETTGSFRLVAQAAVRTVAHETLLSLAKNHRPAFARTYMWRPNPMLPDEFHGINAFGRENDLPPGARRTYGR